MHHNADKMIKVGDVYVDRVDVGTKIKFTEGRRLKNSRYYTVQASNRFYSICTLKINMIRRKGGGKYEFEKTVLYSIVDWVHKIRGTENLVFGMGAETKKDCREMLARLTSGDSNISQRNWCELEIKKVIFPK